MFPPLKAVLGALSVLTKNYDVSSSHPIALQTANHALQQTIANAEQIKDIEARVESLSGILTLPVGDLDAEERGRRESLKRFALPPPESTRTLQTGWLFAGRYVGSLQSSDRYRINTGS